MALQQINAISNRLSLRPPQRDSLEILARVCEITSLEKDGDADQALETISSEFPTVEDFERDFPSLCFALATGVGKTRLMGAFISYLYDQDPLRYYERIGLLKPEDRSQGNYRLYTDESLGRVEFIRTAQGIGFTLVDVKTLLGRANGTSPCCGDVQTLVRERLADIEKRLKDLRHVRNVLKSTLQKCQESEELGLCYVVDKLRRKN